MALFYECMLKCARKLLDTADIVREAIFSQRIARWFQVGPFSGVGSSLVCASMIN